MAEAAASRIQKSDVRSQNVKVSPMATILKIKSNAGDLDTPKFYFYAVEFIERKAAKLGEDFCGVKYPRPKSGIFLFDFSLKRPPFRRGYKVFNKCAGNALAIIFNSHFVLQALRKALYPLFAFLAGNGLDVLLDILVQLGAELRGIGRVGGVGVLLGVDVVAVQNAEGYI